MKKKRFSVEQIVAALEADRARDAGGGGLAAAGDLGADVLPLEEAVYAGLQSDQVRELKLLQEENARLKKLVAELSLDKAILQDINSKKWPGPR